MPRSSWSGIRWMSIATSRRLATTDRSSSTSRACSTRARAKTVAIRGSAGSMKQVIRVLLIAPSMEFLGGQAVQAARLLEGLRKEDSLSIDFLPMNSRLPGPLRLLHQVKYVRTATMVFTFLVKLLARLGRYDILHVFSAAYFSFWWSA